ncbi:MAG TPA: hypothetical protein VIC84_23355 [Blastocatellia bacterium]|jgi:hypothetical protein
MAIVKISAYLSAVFLTITITDHQRNVRYLNWPGSVEPLTLWQAQPISIENTIGVVTLNDKRQDDPKSTVQIFNEDGGIWYEFSFYDDNPDHPFDHSRKDFEPFAFHLDYFLLAFKCVGEDANRYEVIVNETTGLRKFIKKSDNTFKLQTWEDHILSLFAVDFDRAKNRLRNAPTIHAALVSASEDAFFHPVKIEGNWLKVSWDVSETEGVKNTKVKKKIGYGWVKWKEGNNIIIELYYLD